MREYAVQRVWTIIAQVKEVGSGASERKLREKLLEAARRREMGKGQGGINQGGMMGNGRGGSNQGGMMGSNQGGSNQGGMMNTSPAGTILLKDFKHISTSCNPR